LTDGVSVTIGVVAGTFVRLLAVETGDSPEVGRGNEEGGHPQGEENAEGSVGNDVVFTHVLARTSGKVSSTTSVVHVDVKAGSVDDQQHRAGAEACQESPEEEAGKLRSAGKAGKESEDGNTTEDDAAHQECP